jgi:hypothetical protein
MKRSSLEFSNRDNFMSVITAYIKTKCFRRNCRRKMELRIWIFFFSTLDNLFRVDNDFTTSGIPVESDIRHAEIKHNDWRQRRSWKHLRRDSH